MAYRIKEMEKRYEWERAQDKLESQFFSLRTKIRNLVAAAIAIGSVAMILSLGPRKLAAQKKFEQFKIELEEAMEQYDDCIAEIVRHNEAIVPEGRQNIFLLIYGKETALDFVERIVVEDNAGIRGEDEGAE